MMNLARYAKLPFDAILGAEPTQSYKPQPQAYLGSAEIAGLAPSEVALVAAHPDDLRAARDCGLATMFVLLEEPQGVQCGGRCVGKIDH